MSPYIIGHHHTSAILCWNWIGTTGDSIQGSIIWVLVPISSLPSCFRSSGAAVGLRLYIARTTEIVNESGRNVAALCSLLHRFS